MPTARNLKNLTNHWRSRAGRPGRPTARTIAFAGNRGNAGYQIFLMNADGSNVRLLAATEGRGTAPKWAAGRPNRLSSPICRSSQESGRAATSSSAQRGAGRDDRAAACATRGCDSLRRHRACAIPIRSLSPDGRRLLFHSNRSGRQAIWIAGADGSEPRVRCSTAAPWERSGEPRLVAGRARDRVRDAAGRSDRSRARAKSM